MSVELARLTLLVLVVVVGVVAVSTAVVTHAVECQPGEYIYNESGAVICIPNVVVNETPFFNFHANMSDDGTEVYVYVVVTDPRGVELNVTLTDSNATKLFTDAISLEGGQYYSWDIKFDKSYDVLFVKFVANGYEFGPYPVTKPEIASVINYSELDPRVAVIVIIAAISPVLGVVLRPAPKEVGVALIAISFLYIPVLYAFGFSFPIPEIVVSVVFVTGLALVMSSRS